VNQFCESHHLKSFLYLRYYNAGDRKSAVEQHIFNLVYRDYLKTVARYAHYGFLQEKKMPLSQVNQIQSSARVLLDINHAHRQGMTIIVVTHELDVGKRADRIINIIDGQVFTGKSEYQENGKTK
jgi:hypothetical protein